MKSACMIVPTGVGASIGGFAGDASRVARKLSEKLQLIVNPNVVNAACFSGITPNMLYVEGFSINEFFQSKTALIPSKNNKIGIIFDKKIPQDVLNIHINTINAVKTVYDINIQAIEITKKNVEVSFAIQNSGISSGEIKNPDTLIDAAENLINKGCNAIAVVCLFPEAEDDDYENGNGVDIVGGVEAIISHLLSKTFQIPVAHAPAFADYSITSKLVNAKAAAEYITPTFLPCILLGLQNAPMIEPLEQASRPQTIRAEQLSGLIMPYNSLGCIPAIEAQRLKIPVFAIKENKTVLNVTAKNLGINAIELDSYEDLIKILD